MPELASDSNQAWLRALYQRKPVLDLSALDLCFLVALQRRAQQLSLASFDEQRLLDTFAAVCRLVAPDLEQLGARATHSLRRLRQQQLLTRVDGAGIGRAGEYALSRLGSAIVDFFVEDEALSPESLELLADTLLASLRDTLARARKAKRPRDWQAGVVGPLRITTADLILGIERRQRGLDIRQAEFRREISRWLEQDWFGAIERCQELLDATAQTLRQLSELLLSYTHQFQTVLQDLLELAVAAEQDIAEAMVHRTMGQIDRIAVWGSARQAAWSEYYDHVHRYLREVVRLDPARALTARLREQLSGHALAPFSLLVADAEPLWVLRSVLPPAPAAPVRRPRGPRSEKLEERAVEPVPDVLETRVQELLGQGNLGLSELTARATADLPEQDHFAGAGKVAELAARWAEPQLARERPWVTVREGLVIEDWHIDTARIEALHAEPPSGVAPHTAAGSDLPSSSESTVLAEGSASQFVEVEA